MKAQTRRQRHRDALETPKPPVNASLYSWLDVAAELKRLSTCERVVRVRLERMRRVAPLPEKPRVLDLGCGTGLHVAAFARAGCDVTGVEPFDAARDTAAEVLRELGVNAPVIDGSAERIPLDDRSFDFVYANQVIEHVADPAASFGEVARVLAPGGLFWFSAVSVLCPVQNEIRGFPLFPWYPGTFKRRIMCWARDNHPRLVGYTPTPAIHWFTPRKARRMLKANGFDAVWDRWDLRGVDEGGPVYRVALSLVKSLPPARLLANVAVHDCAYGARRAEKLVT